ncbi:MAG TPA: hypothetical protein VNU92_16415 [Edaphobacter sp.]|jgi:hypothetical protein|nr:hypothetical protein [Edaphobacter sp.]
MVKPSCSNNCGADQSVRFTDDVVERLARLRAYYLQTAAREMNRRSLPGQNAADDNDIGPEPRFLVPSPVFHKAWNNLYFARGRPRPSQV